MVFFTSILIIIILYYLQADGLIYAVIIALITEFINIFLTHTLTKSIEAKLKSRHRKTVEGYTKRIKANKKIISDLERLQEEAANKIYKANERIKALEEALDKKKEYLEPLPPQSPPLHRENPADDTDKFIDHLPDGSRSKKRPPRI